MFFVNLALMLELGDEPTLGKLIANLLGLAIWAPLVYQWLRGRNDTEDRALFLLQLADMLRLGVTAGEALAQLATVWRREFSYRFGDVSYLVRSLESQVSMGSSLAQAFQETKGTPAHWAITLRMCNDEETTIKVLSELGEAEKARLRLPLMSTLRAQVILILLLGVAFFLSNYILPTFAELAKGTGQELPLGTQLLLALDGELFSGGFALCLGLGLSFLFLGVPFLAVRRLLWRMAAYTPFLGRLVRLLEQRRLYRLLATATGLERPLAEVLEITAQGASLPQYRRCLNSAAQNGAGSLSEVLEAHPRLFRRDWVWLVRQGEALENLPAALATASELAAREHTDLNERLATNLDTMLLLGLGSLVGGVVISAILPNYIILETFIL